MAGLTAAAQLLVKSKSVLVLEARNRVGGRVESVLVNGQLVELGGQWVSPGHDKLLDLINRYGLETLAADHGDSLVRLRGEVFSSTAKPDDAQALSPFEIADLGQGMMRLRRLAKRSRNDPTWTQANTVWLDQPLDRWVATNLRTPGARQGFLSLIDTAVGAPRSHQTLRQVLNAAVCGIDLESLFAINGGLRQRRIKGGMAQLCEQMAADLGQCVKLGAVVNQVCTEGHSLAVSTLDGQRFDARAVIVAIPPWLAQRLDYEPKLPTWRDDVVTRTSPGNVVKACAVYEHPWWFDRGLSGQSSSDEGPVRVTFGTVDEREGPGVLTGFIAGADASSMSRWSLTLRDRVFTDALETIFGEQARAPHVYVDRMWGQEPFSEGSQGAHFAPGVWTVNGQLLAEPVGQIHFAGAEYAGRFNGYLEGAIRSGTQAAATVLRQLEPQTSVQQA